MSNRNRCSWCKISHNTNSNTIRINTNWILNQNHRLWCNKWETICNMNKHLVSLDSNNRAPKTTGYHQICLTLLTRHITNPKTNNTTNHNGSLNKFLNNNNNMVLRSNSKMFANQDTLVNQCSILEVYFSLNNRSTNKEFLLI